MQREKAMDTDGKKTYTLVIDTLITTR
jgi:hypothetical protein